MPAGFYKLKVGKINRETNDAVSIELMVPPPFRSEFDFKAGQYLTFSIEIQGKEVRRSYSLCTSPTDEKFAVAVKRVEGGLMSNYLNGDLQEGQMIDAMPPNGNFIYEPNPNASRQLVLFGGGSGITPVKSILESALEHEPNSKVLMIYANRDTESIIFGSDLDAHAAAHDNFTLIHSLDNPPSAWLGLSGYLNKEVIENTLNNQLGEAKSDAIYYICGPGPMMDVVTASLSEIGIPAAQVITEYFVAKADETQEDDEEITGLGTYNIEVELFGDEEEITVKEGETILDAAIQADLDPPYSCQSGVCTTCRAKLIAGKIHMKEREGLTDDEVEDNYILTCQSHPISSGVKVRYE
jgi:ring-1,2-phenylacetyl-CoA epoxidase subunit PaaE